MKHLGGISLGLVLSAAALTPLPATAGPFGSVAEIRNAVSAPIVDVRHRRSHRRALAAGALIGAAIVGGAIIANSQRSRQYYIDDGYYGDGPYYGPPVYYGYPSGPGYIVNTPDMEMPYTYAPSPGYYYSVPRRQRFVRDPAGGGMMK